MNPVIDRDSGKVYVPNAVHTALLQVDWLEGHMKTGTVIVLSNEEDLQKLKAQISVLKIPNFWKYVEGQNLMKKVLKGEGKWESVHTNDCNSKGCCKDKCKKKAIINFL